MINKIQRLKNKKGFTLVELIVVIGIVAVLTAVIVPLIGRYSTQAAFTALQDAAKTISDNINTCMATYNSRGNPVSCLIIRGEKDNGEFKVGFEGATLSEEEDLRDIIKKSLTTALPANCAFTCEIDKSAVAAVVFSNGYKVTTGTVGVVSNFTEAYEVDGEPVGVAGKYMNSGQSISAFAGTLS